MFCPRLTAWGQTLARALPPIRLRLTPWAACDLGRKQGRRRPLLFDPTVCPRPRDALILRGRLTRPVSRRHHCWHCAEEIPRCARGHKRFGRRQTSSRAPSCFLLGAHNCRLRKAAFDTIFIHLNYASDHHIPIIFLTAYPDEDVRIRAMKAGAIGFLRKPCSDEHLLGYLNKALRRSDIGTGDGQM
jgi:hypothetical protein